MRAGGAGLRVPGRRGRRRKRPPWFPVSRAFVEGGSSLGHGADSCKVPRRREAGCTGVGLASRLLTLTLAAALGPDSCSGLGQHTDLSL